MSNEWGLSQSQTIMFAKHASQDDWSFIASNTRPDVHPKQARSLVKKGLVRRGKTANFRTQYHFTDEGKRVATEILRAFPLP